MKKPVKVLLNESRLKQLERALEMRQKRNPNAPTDAQAWMAFTLNLAISRFGVEQGVEQGVEK